MKRRYRVIWKHGYLEYPDIERAAAKAHEFELKYVIQEMNIEADK